MAEISLFKIKNSGNIRIKTHTISLPIELCLQEKYLNIHCLISL
jgi:hypothetical protein